MKYWNEYCPKCGNIVARRSDLHNGSGYGCPVETCRFCGRSYINSKMIEVALVDKKYYPKLIFGGVVSDCIYTALFGFGIWLLLFIIFDITRNPFPNELIIKILVGIWVVVNGCLALSAKKGFNKRLRESQERLKDKKYAELLKNSGYVPKI